jgi:hypothetical protein
LIYKKYEHGGLTQEEEGELEELQEIAAKHQDLVAPIKPPIRWLKLEKLLEEERTDEKSQT